MTKESEHYSDEVPEDSYAYKRVKMENRVIIIYASMFLMFILILCFGYWLFFYQPPEHCWGIGNTLDCELKKQLMGK